MGSLASWLSHVSQSPHGRPNHLIRFVAKLASHTQREHVEKNCRRSTTTTQYYHTLILLMSRPNCLNCLLSDGSSGNLNHCCVKVAINYIMNEISICSPHLGAFSQRHREGIVKPRKLQRSHNFPKIDWASQLPLDKAFQSLLWAKKKNPNYKITKATKLSEWLNKLKLTNKSWASITLVYTDSVFWMSGSYTFIIRRLISAKKRHKWANGWPHELNTPKDEHCTRCKQLIPSSGENVEPLVPNVNRIINKISIIIILNVPQDIWRVVQQWIREVSQFCTNPVIILLYSRRRPASVKCYTLPIKTHSFHIFPVTRLPK